MLTLKPVPNNIHKIIRERRSSYPHEFNGKIVEDAVIKQLIENAHWAPNHYLNFPWRFIVLQGVSLSACLQKVLDIEGVSETSNLKKFQKIEMFKQRISHAIVLVQTHTEQPKATAFEDALSIAAGVQNMYLGLSDYEQVGGYWSTGLCNNHPDMKSHLHLAESETMLGYFILGMLDHKRTEANRPSVDSRIQYL
jgi:nitroreductase